MNIKHVRELKSFQLQRGGSPPLCPWTPPGAPPRPSLWARDRHVQPPPQKKNAHGSSTLAPALYLQPVCGFLTTVNTNPVSGTVFKKFSIKNFVNLV